MIVHNHPTWTQLCEGRGFRGGPGPDTGLILVLLFYGGETSIATVVPSSLHLSQLSDHRAPNSAQAPVSPCYKRRFGVSYGRSRKENLLESCCWVSALRDRCRWWDRAAPSCRQVHTNTSVDIIPVKAFTLLKITLPLRAARTPLEFLEHTEPEFNELSQMSGQMPCFVLLLNDLQPDDRFYGLFVCLDLFVGDSLVERVCDCMMPQ